MPSSASKLIPALTRQYRAILWIWLVLIALSLLSLQLLPQKVMTESTGARQSEAFQVMETLRTEFGLQMGNTLALLLEGKPPPPAVLKALSSQNPQIKALLPVPELQKPDQRLYLLELQPSFQFVEGPEWIKKLRQSLKQLGKQHHFQASLTGNLAFYADIMQESESYFSLSEFFALSAAFVILFLSFGGLLASFLPILMGLSSLIVFQGFLKISSLETTSLSATLNSLLGLALAVDYSLFWVSRFREERPKQAGLEQALVSTTQTAGKTILVSALIVFSSIGVLLIPDISGMRIMALNLCGVIFFSMLHAFLFLPALVRILAPALDWPQSLTRWLKNWDRTAAWQAYARHITAYPKRYFALSLGLILLLCLPVLNMKLWDPVQTLASAQAESVQAYEKLAKQGLGGKMVPLYVLIQAPAPTQIKSPAGLAYLDQFSRYLKAQPQVEGVLGLMSWHPDFKKADYLSFYQNLELLEKFSAPWLPTFFPQTHWVNAQGTTHLLTVFPKDIMNIESVHQISDAIRAYAQKHPEYQVRTGGVMERARDFSQEMYRHTGLMIALVLGAIFIILFGYMKAVLLPIKAGLMNFVPILGAFGILTAIYQYGWFSTYLHTPVNGAVSSMIPMTLFCILFGLSMDYEVLILSRISEAYAEGLEVREAIVKGMAHSGSVISSAALIFLALFLPAALSHSPAIRELGIGIVAALLLDATVLRLLWVPSFMMLMGKWNWWKPGR